MKSKPTTLARTTPQATIARPTPTSPLHATSSTHTVSIGPLSRFNGLLTATSNVPWHTTTHSMEQTSRKRPWCSNLAFGPVVTLAKAKELLNGLVARRTLAMPLSRCTLSRSTLPTTILPSPTPTATLLALIPALFCRTPPALATPA